ncbi:mitochondrial tRNA-specific 2-thiouridylase 1 isoform X1 [Panulirus ornatus]|uniref:mitochondrial tRNA-specific 2-thiouridylase 1 isoform X1 n=1 Tax=Panulirus ornatus TaxID=150431 RepID=UPI003A894473
MAGVTKRFPRVVLGISGGVDSAVSALLLKRKGYEVIGVFMRNWDEKDEKGHCTTDAEAEDAEWVCRRLDIPFHEVNFVKEYWHEVFTHMIEEYKAGFTPNPDIICNKKVKFSPFLNHAQENFSTEVIATGHYARTSFGEDLENYDTKMGARLLQSIDRLKDQTFFLSQIPQKSLQHTMFPIGRSLHLHLINMHKRWLTCMKKILFSFPLQYIEDKPGKFIDLDTQEVVGSHNGIHQWTIGQRCNLSPFPQPYFVCEKHPVTNDIYVAAGTNHPALFTTTLFTEPVYWIHSPPSDLYTKGQLECQFRFQNTAPLVSCVITTQDDNPWHRSVTQNNMVVSLAEPLRAVTPGQYAVFYLGDECIGSSRILRPGPSLYTLNVDECRTRILKEKLKSPSESHMKTIPSRSANKQEATEE